MSHDPGDENGDMHYAVTTKGTASTSSLIGLLEMAKFDVLTEAAA